jgi:type 1 glutamine amidotransferase
MGWIKYTLMGVAGVLLLAILGGYFYLKSLGIIPREIYETVPPEIPDFSRPAILVLNKANGFVHVDALPAADEAFTQIAQARGWDIFLTNNAASHNTEDLNKFKLVIWNNVSADVLTTEQRRDLRNWIEQGGGWLGVHGSGGDPQYKWPWYVDTLIGAQFVGHTMDPQFQDADVNVVDESLEIVARLPRPWRIANEEWYAFDASPRDKGYEILLTIDEGSYITRGETFMWDDNMEGEHPLVWRHAVGDGRAFYSAIGHQAATYSLPEYRTLLANAMAWAMAIDN